MAIKSKKTSSSKKAKKQIKDFYFDEKVKNWDYSDFVRISSYPRGLILSFGKYSRDDKKFGIFKEILLPFDVADSLSSIIREQIDQLEREGKIVKPDELSRK